MDIFRMSRISARKFLKQHQLLNPPFNIEKCLNILNISLTYNYHGNSKAFLLITNHHKYIVIDKYLPIQFQRFFIAHEIAHLILKHHGIAINKLFAYNKIWEDKLADECARELLIPKKILIYYANIYKYDIQKLKKVFEVSELDMVIKMRRSGLPYSNTVYKNLE